MFTDKMPDVTSAKQLTVYRAQANKPVQGMLAGLPVRVLSHWWRGKTIPCLKDEDQPCPLCDRGVDKRYYAYYPLRNAKGSSAIVEMTATAEAELTDHLKLGPKKSIPILKVYRLKGKRNSPVHCDVDWKPCSEKEWTAFERVKIDQDLIKRTLARLWNLPQWPESMTLKDYEQLARKHVAEVVAGNI
jgi:hypothetical protein